MNETHTGFVAGTLVHTVSGLVPIQQLKAGDVVLSKPLHGGEIEPRRIIGTHSSADKKTWLLEYFTSGTQYTRHLVGTGAPSFFVDEHEWRQSSDVEPGHMVGLIDGSSAGVYRLRWISGTDTPGIGWTGDDPGALGPLIDLRDGKVIVNKIEDDVCDPSTRDNGYFVREIFTLEVEDFGTYFVGDAGVWVREGR